MARSMGLWADHSVLEGGKVTLLQVLFFGGGLNWVVSLFQEISRGTYTQTLVDSSSKGSLFCGLDSFWSH